MAINPNKLKSGDVLVHLGDELTISFVVKIIGEVGFDVMNEEAQLGLLQSQSIEVYKTMRLIRGSRISNHGDVEFFTARPMIFYYSKDDWQRGTKRDWLDHMNKCLLKAKNMVDQEM